MNVNTGAERTAIVSYAHSDPLWGEEQKNERAQHVLRFVHALRQHGISADLDLFHPNEDWTRWGPRTILSSDYVLIVVSQAWRDAWMGSGDLNLNKGLRAEADAVRSIENEGGALRSRCRLILLPGSGDADIPGGMHGIMRYYLKTYDLDDLEDLLRDLTDQPKHVQQPVGAVPVLPPAMTSGPPKLPDDDTTSSPNPNLDLAQQRSDVLPESDEGADAFEHMRSSGIIASHVTGESQQRITQLLTQLAALPKPDVSDGPHLPWFRVRNKIESQLHREIQSANDLGALTDPEAWATTRFVWSPDPDSYTDIDIEITESEVAAGEFMAGSGFPGPSGTYYRIDDEMGYAIKENDPLPTFLHEAHEAHIKTWVTRIDNLSEEAKGAADTYDALDELMKLKIIGIPDARMGSPIVTTTERKPNGDFVVVGRAVYLTPRAKSAVRSIRRRGTARSRWRRYLP